MARARLHPDNVGNTHDLTAIQGWNFPLPEDDIWSCEGTEDSHEGYQDTLTLFQADEPQLTAEPIKPVCRAATGSIGAQPVALTVDQGSDELTSPDSQQHITTHLFDGEQSNWCNTTPSHFGVTVAGTKQPMALAQGMVQFGDTALTHERPTGHIPFPGFDTASTCAHGQPLVI